MRISPGYLRSGLADPGFVIPTVRPTIVTPHPISTKAVRIFHSQGLDAANEYLRTSLSTDTWKKPRNATKARIARECFDRYTTLAGRDTRVAFLGDPRATVEVAGHQVSAGCEVVTLEPQGGHAGRLCLWGVIARPFTENELALIACPVVLALQEEFGDDSVAGIEVWFLRAGEVATVTADTAVGQLPNLSALVRRIVPPAA